jgi:hypothetical protein
MNDKCEIKFSKQVERELKKLAKKEPQTVAALAGTLKHIEELGWEKSTWLKLIKILRSETCIGEIRHIGEVAYRFIFFWEENEDGYVIVITDVLKKSILKPNRLNEYITKAEKRRKVDQSAGENDENTEEIDELD